MAAAVAAGYSGGNGGTNGADSSARGGGGGSYNVGTNQVNAINDTLGDGSVIITVID